MELLKTIKADREDLEDALADKADAQAINRKVGSCLMESEGMMDESSAFHGRTIFFRFRTINSMQLAMISPKVSRRPLAS